MKKGISLVALVITIVVLVILTGAVIITTIDSNIMGNTQTTVDMYNKKAIIEDINMKIQTEKLKKVNQGIYKLTMTDILPIIQTYGDFNNTTLKLTTTTTTKAIEIWMYEIMNIPLEEYATISYTNNILTVTTQLPSDLYRVQYTTSGGTSWELYNSPVTIAQESGIQIRLLNTEGTVVSNTLKLTNGYAEEIDNTVPSITIEPNGIGLAKKMQVTITVTDDNELATNNTYKYCLIQSQTSPANNSTEWKAYTNGEAFTIGTGLTGTYYLHVKAVNDVAGNTSGNVVSNSYTFDNRAPNEFTPIIGEVTQTSIEIMASTTDNNGQAVTYRYSINNGIDWQSSNIFTGLTAGTTYDQIQVEATDTLGNQRLIDNIVARTEYSYTNYIQNGLSSLYDGIQNTTNGHSTNTTVWHDLSGNGNNGTINGAVWQENGLYFDGTNDWVNLGQIQTGNVSNFTWETVFIANSNSIMDVMTNMDIGGMAISCIYSSICCKCYIAGTYRNVPEITVEIGKIYSVSLTYNGSVIKVYINGELINSLNYSGVVSKPANNTVLALGANPYGSGVKSDDASWFNGTIYSARVYNRALTDSEILNNYNVDSRYTEYSYTNYIQNGLSSLYDGIQNTTNGHSTNTTVWYDLSGNGNNGTINGAVWQENGLYFDGTNDWVNLGQIQTGNVSALTWEFIFKPLNSFFSVMGNWEMGGGGFDTNNNKRAIQVGLYIGGAYRVVSGVTALILNDIYTVSATYDGSVIKLYINGELIDSLNYAGVVSKPANNTILALGLNPYGSGVNPDVNSRNWFNGTIYSARVYNRELTDSEILNNYNVDSRYR